MCRREAVGPLQRGAHGDSARTDDECGNGRRRPGVTSAATGRRARAQPGYQALTHTTVFSTPPPPVQGGGRVAARANHERC